MNVIDSAIMANLTRNESLNSIIANMPGIADNETFVETVAAGFAEKNNPEIWNCSESAVEMIKSFRTKPGFNSAMRKVFLFAKTANCCQFNRSELALLAIDRMAAEPDGDHAELWLNIAAAMLLEIIPPDSDTPDFDEPF